MLLITDGQVWAVDAVVEAAVRSGQRIFVIGVGHSPSEATLRRLADETGGACDIVPPGEDLHEAILRMFQRIRHQTHARLSVEWGAEPLWQVPLPPAIYPGDTVHLMAAFPRGCPVRPVLQLQAGDLAISCAAPPVQSLDNSGLSRLAAARRLATLPEHARSDWAVRYQLVSADSNLVLTAEREVKSITMPTLERVRHTQAAMRHNMVRHHIMEVSYARCEEQPCMSPRQVSVETMPSRELINEALVRSGLASGDTKLVDIQRSVVAQLLRLTNYDISIVRDLLNQRIVETGDLDRLPALFARPEQPETLQTLSDLHRTHPERWLVVLLILRMRCGADTLTRHVCRVLDRIEKELNDAQRSDLDIWARLFGSAQSFASP